MIRIAATLALTGGLLSSAPQSAQADNLDIAVSQLPEIVEQTMARTGIPGLAVAVVRGDRVVYSQGFGVRSTVSGRPVTPDTVFQIASLSKPVGATAVAAAVGQKELRWDDPIAKFLPDFQMDGAYVTKHVTVADMYAHRSGLPGVTGNDLEAFGYGRKAITKRIRHVPLSPFRVTYSYSNYGLTVGGLAAAEAAGTTWPTLARRLLFKPLGMNHTSYRHSDFMKQPNRAEVHEFVAGTYKPVVLRKPDAQAPAGGLSSTTLDLAKWMRLQLANGKYDGQRVVAKTPLQQARSLQIRTVPPEADATAIGGYALGMNTSVSPNGYVHWGHSGAFLAGASTNVLMIPELDTGIVVLTNAWPVGVPEAITASYAELAETGTLTKDWLNEIAARFAAMTTPNRTVEGAPKPADPKPAARASTYTGTYRNDYLGTVKVVQRGGRLVMRIGPNLKTRIPLSHWTGDTFAYALIDEWVTGRRGDSRAQPPVPRGFTTGAIFSTIEGGKAQQLYVEQSGQDVGVLRRM